MADAAKDREAVLSDSEATLRQVRGVLEDLGTPSNASFTQAEAVSQGLQQSPTGLQDLMSILTKSYAEITEVIDSLRNSRGLLEQAAMERLQNTHHKLAEVTSATEMAATGMLDGLDRALVLVDHLEVSEAPDHAGGAPLERGTLRNELREELHQLINLLQFQDITAQQLGYASGVLLDIEGRMERLAKVFDLRGMGFDEAHLASVASAPDCLVDDAEATNDPMASTLDADSRQALADEIFT